MPSECRTDEGLEGVAVVEPASIAGVAAALRAASDCRQSVVIRGAGTKIGWGRAPKHVDVVLSTRAISRIVTHQHGDLTATVEAGASLHEVNQALAQHGQCLPLDPPFADRATIGGVLATNDSGPLRHRFGTPRDLIIGIQLATTDGMLARAGGQVVKNVAGYDLSKLVTGSFGSLAAIVSATFKLTPLPHASKTIVVRLPQDAADGVTLGRMVREVMASQIEPIAFEIHIGQGGSGRGPREDSESSSAAARASGGGAPRAVIDDGLGVSVLVRFASLDAVVNAQVNLARAILSSRRGEPEAKLEVVENEAEQRLWQEHAGDLWDAPGAIVRANWLPAQTEAVVTTLEELSQANAIELIGRAAVGSGLIRIDADIPQQAAVIERLRQSAALGHVIIVRATNELKALVDVWGQPTSLGDRGELMSSLKRAFDPEGILNAGRGPL